MDRIDKILASLDEIESERDYDIAQWLDSPKVLRTWHDDWIFWVILWDGRVFAFNTELWLEHSDETDRRKEWSAVRLEAIRRAHALANNGYDPYCIVPQWAFADVAADERHARAYCDAVCEQMSDYNFSRLVRR